MGHLDLFFSTAPKTNTHTHTPGRPLSKLSNKPAAVPGQPSLVLGPVDRLIYYPTYKSLSSFFSLTATGCIATYTHKLPSWPDPRLIELCKAIE